MGRLYYKVNAEFDTTFLHKKSVLFSAIQGGPSNPKKKKSSFQFYIIKLKKWSTKQ